MHYGKIRTFGFETTFDVVGARRITADSPRHFLLSATRFDGNLLVRRGALQKVMSSCSVGFHVNVVGARRVTADSPRLFLLSASRFDVSTGAPQKAISSCSVGFHVTSCVICDGRPGMRLPRILFAVELLDRQGRGRVAMLRPFPVRAVFNWIRCRKRSPR
jgi:hypothetical protein